MPKKKKSSLLSMLENPDKKKIKKLKNIIVEKDNKLDDVNIFLQSILDSSTEYAIIAVDNHKIIQSWNTGAKNIFGYTYDEVVGIKNLSFLIPKQENKSQQAKKAIKKKIATSGIWEGETLRKRKNGTTFYARIVVTPLRNKKNELIGSLAIIRDITKEKKLQEENWNRQILSDKIFNSIPSPIILINSKYKIERANTSFLELSKKKEQQLIKFNLCEALHYIDKTILEKNCFLLKKIKKAKITDTVFEVELELLTYYKRKKIKKFFITKIIPFELFEDKHFLIIFNDYTERRNLQRKIKENIRLLEKKVEERTEKIKKTNQQLITDLESAKLIQKSLLTNNIDRIPQYNYSYIYIPSELIGGDFFAVKKIDEENFYFYISDVSGHGVSAAMLTVFIQQSLPHIISVQKNFSPGRTLTELNRQFFKEKLSNSHFVTVFLCVLNIKTHTLKYAVAGHHNSLIFNPSKNKFSFFGYFSKPIGFMENYEYENKEISLAENDTLLFYTDGLTEIFNKENNLAFNNEKLMQFIKKNSKESESKLLKNIVKHVKTLRSRKTFEDDIAILSIKRFQ